MDLSAVGIELHRIAHRDWTEPTRCFVLRILSQASLMPRDHTAFHDGRFWNVFSFKEQQARYYGANATSGSFDNTQIEDRSERPWMFTNILSHGGN